MIGIGVILALLLLTTPAHGQKFPAIEKARGAYETCVELAALDEYVSPRMDSVGVAMVERAIAACATEENALLAVTALSLSPVGEIAGLKAQTYVAQYRAALKVKVMGVLRDMERSSSGGRR
jgi:hypothetical protein